jgi:hypothetical protein
MSGDSWDELLRELDDDQGDNDDGEWGVKRLLDVGTTLAGWWRGQDEWEGDYGPCPVYLAVDDQGVAFHFYGGREQLDRKIKAAALSLGDRFAVRRLEDAPAEPGKNPAWRVRVAVRSGDGTIPVAEAVEEGVAGDKDDIPY